MNYVQKDHVRDSFSDFLLNTEINLFVIFMYVTFFTLKITCFIHYKF